MQIFPKFFLSIVVAAVLSGCAQEPSAPHDTSANDHGHDEKTQSAPIAPRAVPNKAGEDTRSAKAHSHGEAKLALVLDGTVVTAALDTPLFNILGFEHEAETGAQKAAVQKAENVLAGGAQLFVFNPQAECTPSNGALSIEIGEHDEDDHDDHADDHDADHADHADHDDHDDHDDHGEDEKVHKDIDLEYTYHCEHPERLAHITVNLFEHFEHMSEIELIYLGPDTQKQDVLNRKKTQMKLTKK